MSSTMEYKGYVGSVEFSEQDGVFFGKVMGVRALISYEGTNASELVQDFHTAVDDYLILARKPFTRRTKKFLLKNNINKEEVVWIGDQLLTDVSCANKLDIDCVLVKSISRKSEKWYTKINRLREKRVLNKIAKKDLQLANSIKKIIGERDDVNE